MYIVITDITHNQATCRAIAYNDVEALEAMDKLGLTTNVKVIRCDDLPEIGERIWVNSPKYTHYT